MWLVDGLGATSSALCPLRVHMPGQDNRCTWPHNQPYTYSMLSHTHALPPLPGHSLFLFSRPKSNLKCMITPAIVHGAGRHCPPAAPSSGPGVHTAASVAAASACGWTPSCSTCCRLVQSRPSRPASATRFLCTAQLRPPGQASLRSAAGGGRGGSRSEGQEWVEGQDGSLQQPAATGQAASATGKTALPAVLRKRLQAACAVATAAFPPAPFTFPPALTQSSPSPRTHHRGTPPAPPSLIHPPSHPPTRTDVSVVHQAVQYGGRQALVSAGQHAVHAGDRGRRLAGRRDDVWGRVKVSHIHRGLERLCKGRIKVKINRQRIS